MSVSELKTQLVSRCGLPEPRQLLSTMGGRLISGGFTIADICGTSSAVRMHLDCRSATARSDHANGRDATTPPVKPRQLDTPSQPRQLDTLPSPHPSPSFAPRAPMVEMPFEPITFCRSQPKHDFAPADRWCAVQSQDVVMAHERRLAVLLDETTRYLTREIPATNGLERLLVFRPKQPSEGQSTEGPPRLRRAVRLPNGLPSLYPGFQGSVILVAASTRVVVHIHTFCFFAHAMCMYACVACTLQE